MRIKHLPTRAMALIATSPSTLTVAASCSTATHRAGPSIVMSWSRGHWHDRRADTFDRSPRPRARGAVCANAASVFVDWHQRRE